MAEQEEAQVHFFDSPKPGQLVGKLNWRITTPDGEFFTRDVVQKFKQDPANPAHLVNKDNEYLHYRGEAGPAGWLWQPSMTRGGLLHALLPLDGQPPSRTPAKDFPPNF